MTAVDGLLVRLFVNPFPDGRDTLFVIKAFEDAVAPDHKEIEVGLQLENPDVRITHYHVGIASISDSFGLDIPERFRH